MKIAVIGSGVMGAGIAQVLAAKHEVVLRDILPEALEKALKTTGRRTVRGRDGTTAR